MTAMSGSSRDLRQKRRPRSSPEPRDVALSARRSPPRSSRIRRRCSRSERQQKADRIRAAHTSPSVRARRRRSSTSRSSAASDSRSSRLTVSTKNDRIGCSSRARWPNTASSASPASPESSCLARVARPVDERAARLLARQHVLAVQAIERGHQRGVCHAGEVRLQVAHALHPVPPPQCLEDADLEWAEEPFEVTCSISQESPSFIVAASHQKMNLNPSWN